jgi:hypothetical protein
MFYSDKHLFFTNDDPSSIVQQTPHKSVKKQSRQLEAKFQKYKMQSFQETNHQVTEVQTKPPFPVDVVFTWVENTKSHASNRRYWLEKTKKGPAVSSDNEINRYGNHDELRYSIRSIYQFMPWVRCIFVIVDSEQFPKWLSETSASATIPVCIVPHSLLFGSQFQQDLPTFNSQSIECHLHRIPQLAEQFIYFNDDMFAGAFVSWTDFFTKQGHPKYVFTGVLPTGNKTAAMGKHTMAWINNNNLLDKVFADKTDACRKYPAHQACPMLKTTFVEIWSHPRVNKYLVRTSQSKFREHYDLYAIGFLVFWNLYSNRAEEQNMNTLFVQIYDHTNTTSVCQNIIERSPKLFCLNDGLVGRRKSQGVVIKTFLNFMFPNQTAVENTPADSFKTSKIEAREERPTQEHAFRGTVSHSQVQAMQKQRAQRPFGGKSAVRSDMPGFL